MTACRWDADAKDYLVDGQPCRHDDYGDVTRHCTARRTCAQHVGPREQTCARCIGRVRQDIRAIVDLAVLMPYEATASGVNSEAAVLAGPAADYAVFSARRRISRSWLMANIPDRNLERAMQAYLDDDDEWHPYSVLTRWEAMIREDYEHPVPIIERCRMRTSERAEWETHVSPERARQSCRVGHGPGCWKRVAAPTSVTNAGDYLDRHLVKIAQDEEQDFPLLRREIRTCRNHLEVVLHNSQVAEKGAPCPACSEKGEFTRLSRDYAHWCWDEDCERIHYATDEADRWVCPRDRGHVWTEREYRNWVEERTGGRTA
jgi:hypothetical protein